MATEILSETPGESEPLREPQPERLQEPSHHQDATSSRWWWRGLLAIGIVVVLTAAAVLIPKVTSSREAGHRLTHTIGRGNLVVTVTEQGTLESSDNTEIKCKVRGDANTVTYVIESGTKVKPGDILVTLDTLYLEQQISQLTKNAYLARSRAERSKADVARAEIAISEYKKGSFPSQMMTLEKDFAILESNLRAAQNLLEHAELMSSRGYVSQLEVEEKTFSVTRGKLNLQLKQTEIDVLNEFTQSEQLATLEGDLKAAKAQYEADKERAEADEKRRLRAVEELDFCEMTAERGGMVIHPSAADWKREPLAEGSTVHKDQVLLLMPNLAKMQVKVGIHESVVERVKPGMSAKITLAGRTLDGKVVSVAEVTMPAGWWTGNVVKYDTIIELLTAEGLKPGMSAEVEVIMARHQDVLMIPVTAVVETDEGEEVCWVMTAEGTMRRSLELGDNNDTFIVVKSGLEEGDKVVLDPLASVEESQFVAASTIDKTKQESD